MQSVGSSAEVCSEVSLSWWKDFPLFSLKAWHSSRLAYSSRSPKTSFAGADRSVHGRLLSLVRVYSRLSWLPPADFVTVPRALALDFCDSDRFLLSPFCSKFPNACATWVTSQMLSEENEKGNSKIPSDPKWNCQLLKKEKWFDVLCGINRSWTWCWTSCIMLILSTNCPKLKME